MKKGKWLALALAAVLCAGPLAGCGSDKYVGEPDYSDTDLQFHIGAWIAPPPAIEATNYVNYATEENYEILADSGINTIYSLYSLGAEQAAAELALAEKVGIGYYVRDDTIWQLLDMTDEEIAETDLFDAYKDSPAFKGHLVVDEPGAHQFDDLAALKQKYEKMFPGKDFYVNLYPTYAGAALWRTDSYFEYIDQYIEKVQPEFLSYDSYPLLTDAYGTTSLQEDYLFNKEIIATKTKEAGIPFWTFIQTIGFGLVNRRPQSKADIAFQVYTDLAYGAKGIQHFCYWQPLTSDGNGTVFTEAMISKDGQKTDIYEYAQAVNLEIQTFANAFLNFEWQGTTNYLDEEGVRNSAFNMVNDSSVLAERLNKEYPTKESERIESVTNKEDLLIGSFLDKNGYDGFMLVNSGDPAKNLENAIEIRFNDASKAVVYANGERTVVELDGGTYKATLQSGEGQFVIPFN